MIDKSASIYIISKTRTHNFHLSNSQDNIFGGISSIIYIYYISSVPVTFIACCVFSGTFCLSKVAIDQPENYKGLENPYFICGKHLPTDHISKEF